MKRAWALASFDSYIETKWLQKHLKTPVLILTPRLSKQTYYVPIRFNFKFNYKVCECSKNWSNWVKMEWFLNKNLGIRLLYMLVDFVWRSNFWFYYSSCIFWNIVFVLLLLLRHCFISLEYYFFICNKLLRH